MVENFIHDDPELTKLLHQAMLSRALEMAQKHDRSDDAKHPLRTIWLSEAFSLESPRASGWKKYLKIPGAWKPICPPNQ